MSGAVRYLLDTDILLAYIRAGKLGQYVEDTYAIRASAFHPLICVVTVGEIRAFAPRNNWGQDKIATMNELLEELVWVDIADPQVLDAYVEVVNSRPKGFTIPQNDMWIAAAACATKAVLLTTDDHYDYLAGRLIEREKIDPAKGKP